MKGKRNVRTKYLLHNVTIDRDVAIVVADTDRLYRRSCYKAMAEAQRKEQNLRTTE